MDEAEEARIRDHAAHLALRWHEHAVGPFDGDTAAAYETMIVAAHVLADETRAALQRWVDAGRRTGLSWAQIGALIGISKQAAQQRFGGTTGDDRPLPATAITVRLGAATLNERRVLADAGRDGRELMRVGPMTLIFRQTDTGWEHRRIAGKKPDVEALAVDGWRFVASWFPFHYFKRPIR